MRILVHTIVNTAAMDGSTLIKVPTTVTTDKASAICFRLSPPSLVITNLRLVGSPYWQEYTLNFAEVEHFTVQ